MGYWTEYFSTLLKGLRITSLKERIEVRKLINNLKKADYILYKKLIKEVEGDHRVTQAIQDEKKLLEELQFSSDKAYDLIFNLSTEEMTLLETTKKILEELETFSKAIPANAQLKKVERDLALAIATALKKAQTEDRNEYGQVMLIINESEEKDPKKFMAAVRLAFQNETSQTILAKFAARKEIRTIKVDILELQKIPTIIQGIRKELEKRTKEKEFDAQKFIGELYGTIQKIKKYCNEAFYELFLIKKRDMLWVLKVLLDLHNLRENNIRWARDHLMPRNEALEKNKEIVKVQTEISKHFHIIAQAFRILITRIQRLEKEAEVDWSKW
ncbi:hypothetical protein HYW99_03960 [Candidatus Woesearchaeota archaeon]|nr:hypothetical protein [Candidatus Woesearchaeota archaeon]